MSKITFKLIQKGGLPKPAVIFPDKIEIKENGETKIIRYIPSEKSIYIDKQNAPYDTKGENVTLTSNPLHLDTTDKSKRTLIEFLQAIPTNSKNFEKYPHIPRPDFEEVQEDKLEKEKYDRNLEIVNAINEITALEAKERKVLAYMLEKISHQEMNTIANEKVTNTLIMAAQEDPDKVMEAISDEYKGELDIILEAIEEGVLVRANETGSIINYSSGREFVKEPSNKDAIRLAAIKIRKSEGEKQNILKNLSIKKNGGTFMQDNLQNDFLQAQDFLRGLGVNTFEKVIDKSFELLSSGEPSPLVKSGNSYVLERDKTRLIGVDGEKTILGKDGVYVFLKDNRETYEKQFTIDLSNFLK